MISQTMQDALNDQINNEFYSSFLYLAMAAYCEANNLPGFGHWLRVQSQEEHSHAMRLFDFILNRGGRVVLKTIAQPPVEFHSPLDVMQQTHQHELEVTNLIHQLYSMAVQEADFATQVHLQPLITEQVEEEKITTDIVAQLKMIGNRSDALLLLDRELAKRQPGRPVVSEPAPSG
jgi:ferritin